MRAMNSQRLTRSLPAHSTDGLPVYLAASPATPFLGFARNDKPSPYYILNFRSAAETAGR